MIRCYAGLYLRVSSGERRRQLSTCVSPGCVRVVVQAPGLRGKTVGFSMLSF
jgi:hypothetical protein